MPQNNKYHKEQTDIMESLEWWKYSSIKIKYLHFSCCSSFIIFLLPSNANSWFRSKNKLYLEEKTTQYIWKYIWKHKYLQNVVGLI